MDGWMDGGVCWIFWMMKSPEDHVTYTRMTSLIEVGSHRPKGIMIV